MRIRTQSTVSQELPAKTRYIIRHDDCQQLHIEPYCPELDQLLRLRGISVTDDPGHGYRLERRSESLVHCSHGIANAGLAFVVAYVLMRLGHEVEVERPPVRRLAKPIACSNPHVAEFIYSNSHGLIRHGLGFEGVAELCVDIAKAIPDGRLAFVGTTEEFVERVHAELAKHFDRVTLAFPKTCNNPGERITVATAYGLGHAEVILDSIDVVIFVDAAAAVGELCQTVLFGHGRSRLFGLMRQDRELPPRIRDRMMAAFGPAEVAVPRLGFQNRQVAVGWARIEGGPRIAYDLTGYRLYSHGIVKHPVRNRWIAQLAVALTNNDQSMIRRICPAACMASNTAPRKTLIITGDIDHAIELAGRLVDWPLVTSDAVHLRGLSVRQRRVLESHRLLSLDPGRAIVTVGGINTVDLAAFDVVIWAAGCQGLPDVPRDQLILPATDGRALLWIDFRDGHHAELRRASGQRRQAYTAAGWYPIGQPSVLGNIKRFVADQTRGGA